MENSEIINGVQLIKDKEPILNQMKLDSNDNILINDVIIGSSSGNASGKIDLNTSQTRTLSNNTTYDVTSPSVAGSTLTILNGTKTGQTIDIFTSCSGFSQTNYFTIVGNINGVPSSNIKVSASFVKYSFTWSNSSKTWVLPHNVII